MTLDPDARRPILVPRLPRRELLSAAASGLMGFVSACAQPGFQTAVVQTPDGKVLQWERDELLVLVSGLQDSYRQGEEIRLKVLLNNQTGRFGLYKVRTKLAGRGQQVVAEAPVASVQVKPFDATEFERVLALPPGIAPGDYTIIIELPPWSLDNHVIGGGSLTAQLAVR